MFRLPARIEVHLRRHWPELFPNRNTGEHWDTAWARHGRDGYRATSELPGLRRKVMALLPDAGTLLDVGCGPGEMMIRVRHERPALVVTGVDISRIAVDTVRARGFSAHVVALPHLPFPAEHFDAVICLETLEHVTDARSTIRAIARVLKPGGRFVLSVPDGAVDVDVMHVHRWTESSLRRSLVEPWVDVTCERHCEGADISLIATARKA